METHADQEIVDLIKTKKMDKALSLIYNRHSRDCLPLIRMKTRNLNRYEMLSMFYGAFLDLSDRIASGAYEYRDDPSFLSYFKTACVNQAREYNRTFCLPDFILSSEILGIMQDDCRESEKIAREDFIQEKKKRYGIDLELPVEKDGEADPLTEVVKAFHTLSDRCKFLIVLKFFVNLSHREIVDALNLFFEIRNEDVSKSELHRCLRYIKERSVIPAA